MALAYNAAEDFNTFVLPGAAAKAQLPPWPRGCGAVALCRPQTPRKDSDKLEDAVALLLVARGVGTM